METYSKFEVDGSVISKEMTIEEAKNLFRVGICPNIDNYQYTIETDDDGYEVVVFEKKTADKGSLN